MKRTRIKFCGMTRREDIDAAIALGVDYLGLVFAPRSRRRLDPAAASRLLDAAPRPTCVVALFMDQPADDVHAGIAAVAPDILQFHGVESPAFCAQFGLPYWKVVAMGGGMSDARCQLEFVRHAAAAGWVLDGHRQGEAGGGGRSFDWTRMPRRDDKALLLAGGLDADNVAHAIRLAQPFAVDVSSGIEAAPGAKDHEQMRRFVAAVRRADDGSDPQDEQTQ